MADAKLLARIHRVRTVQLNLQRAEEARAHDKLGSETALRARIAQLADGVAPKPAASAGVSLIAAAHYRERLHQSAAAATMRVSTAEQAAARAADATRSAWRDQAAVEKLIARAKRARAAKEMRALEDAPPPQPRHGKIRHDPC